MAEKIDLSVVIVSFNTKQLLSACIKSVKKFTKGISYEVIVVDNASADGSAEEAEKIGVKVIRNRKNVGFGQANNQGMKESRGNYILLLNSDTEIKSNVLEEMVLWMDRHSGVGVASCNLTGIDGRLQLNGGSFPDIFRLILWSLALDDIPGVASVFGSFHLRPSVKVREQDWVSGAFFMMRREVIEKVGGFDENIFLYGEEVEYCYRIKRLGWKIYFVPIFRIKHLGFASGDGKYVKILGFSIGKESGLLGEFKGIKYFYEKHYPAWQYPIMRLFLKVAALARLFVFGILGGQSQAIKIYAKAFKLA